MKRKPIAYISGAMEGKPKLNFPLFNRVAKEMRNAGFFVMNPAEFGEFADWRWADYISRDLKELAQYKPDYIILIDGWRESAGSQIEVIAARKINPNVKVVEYAEMQRTLRSIQPSVRLLQADC